MNITQAAKIANINSKTIQRAINAGKLKAQVVRANLTEITQEDLDAYITSRRFAMPVPPSQHTTDLEHRVGELERRIATLEQQLAVLRNKSVKPVALLTFASTHNVVSPDYQRAINMAVLPIQTRKSGDKMLNATSQRVFYQIFHELPYFIACEQCPHGHSV
jgi:hypothetical protein